MAGGDDDEDDPLISAPMIRRTVSAADAAPPPVLTGGFVFDLAGLSPSSSVRVRQTHAPLTHIERADGLVRCTRILPQDTTAWQEREAARRARQKPPRPPKAVLTVGVKLARAQGGGIRTP